MAFYNPSAPITSHTRNLPHWAQGEVWCFVTWRLADALPQSKLRELAHEKEAWIQWHPEPWDDATSTEYHTRFGDRVDAWLDEGSGSCLLRDPINAGIIAGALEHFDAQRYELGAYVVMPNHVHVLVRPTPPHPMADTIKSWKGFSSRKINERTGGSGPLWQAEYWPVFRYWSLKIKVSGPISGRFELVSREGAGAGASKVAVVATKSLLRRGILPTLLRRHVFEVQHSTQRRQGTSQLVHRGKPPSGRGPRCAEASAVLGRD